MRIAALPIALLVAGCGTPAAPDNGGQSANSTVSEPSNAQAAATAPAPAPAPAVPVLTAGGYDTIRIGARPAEAEGYELADDGSYEESCRIYTSPRLPSSYAIVEDGRIMRLTGFQERESGPSPLRTDRGIGVGSTEAEVRAAYTPLQEQPHHYVEAPAKDLFFGGTEREPGLRFEIGADGRVTNVHAGLMPVLGYVEACS
jgi:hypothetical protein